MPWIGFAIVVLGCTVLQAGFVHTLSLGQTEPNLLLIALVYYAIHRPAREAIVQSFLIGLGADIASGTAGPAMISFGICGTLLHLVQQVILMRSPLVQAAAVVGVGVACGGVCRILAWIKAPPVQQTGPLLQALYSAALALGAFLLLDMIPRPRSSARIGRK